MAQLTPTLRRGAALLLLLSLAGCRDGEPKPGTVLDEAKQAQRTVESFPAADEDYFKDMDGAVALNAAEVKGRNTWLVWTGGNDRLWDKLATVSVGNLDLLKTLSSHPGLKFSRDNRWNYLGLVNEPCFDKAGGPDDKRFGLWLDQRRADCPKDPFENEQKYPGVAIGARGKNLPAGSFYGYATGVVGLRLFPNPAFDEAAAKKWDAKRYYEDPTYYNDKDLIRPYRVGMSCAFCHVGPNPVKPPADPEHPKWENLSSNVGAQYFWVDRIFSWQADPSSFPFQLFHTSRPGALDTSLISTDSINNPRTMNAVYGLGPRLDIAKRWGKETLAGGGLNNKQFNDFVKDGPLTQFFQPPKTVWTPRVLKDGSDSVGALGALNRVYLNIGLFSEEWLLHFNPLVGGKTITPIQIADARKNSVYWQSTELQTVDMALFFLKSTDPHKLKDAPGGAQYLSSDAAQLSRGKVVFAENCARCHSSKLPPKVPPLDPSAGCAGPDYLACFNKYWDWTKTEDFKSQMRQIVQADDFLKDNYLSTELRVPVTLLQTNACSPLATNALKGNIWDNFSSKTYKDLPSVGEITVHNPFTGAPSQYKMPAGGRGFTRPASLISVWSTAPFLLNNSLGKFNPSPSVAARMESFNDSIQKLLWPEKREKDKVLGDKVPGLIDRTTARSYLRVPTGYLPDALQELQGPLQRYLPWLFGKDGVELGPIPAGTPVNLISNLQVTLDNPSLGERLKHDKKLLELLLKIKHDLKALPPGASDEEARKVFANLAQPMLELSTCPDFVVNRGHYFGTGYQTKEPGLSDSDKYALIEFLKTF
ncbi:hypothetical protein [Chromobacterium sp. LK11]|uniref:c-type cytochrome n=1 Tax=Chromobacterium sp. LK11 TaxID=1628212 RepID=UPI00069D55B8|nr:hypothetical protein [Chromobacterium sp. LK11]